MPANNLRVTARLLNFLEKWEAFVGYVYDDLVPPRKVKGKLVYREYSGGPVKGTLTIGIGHTAAAKARVDMGQGAKLSHEKAREILDIDLDPCEACINRYVKVPLTQAQFEALVSFTYNVGEGAFRKSSILAKLNQGNYAGARAALALYNKSKGQVRLGLKRRRAAEQALWDADHEVLEALDPTRSEEAMTEVVPKADPVVNERPVTSSSEAMGSVIQTGAGGTGLANEIDKGMQHADRVIAVKNTAEQLGVEPISIFGKLGPVLDYLVHSPIFYISLVVIGFGVFMFFRRKWRMRQEL